MVNKTIVCWWSGGVTSAVACKLAIDLYGLDNCIFLMIDTQNEDDDTYRFKKDCEDWYGKEIGILTNIGPDKKYSQIEDVWYDYQTLNVATGAICSSELKRQVRLDWQRKNKYDHQVFGFDDSEINRAKNLKKNYPATSPIYPLLFYGYSKKDCIDILMKDGIQPPRVYEYGFNNNNCFKTGCVQGGIGYWQKIRLEFPEKFEKMAKLEHELTDLKGEPVTMLKDQSKEAKRLGRSLVFLKPHPDYPEYKDISMMKGMMPVSYFECNGFCGTKGN